MIIGASFTKTVAATILILIGSGTFATAATFTVTNANDSGPGSLRQAILNADAAAGADTIVFDTTFFSTPRTIVLTTGVLSINGDLTISGPGPAKLRP